ncbi:hypothetical protein A3742_06765 [Oleiphilus sp. HI0071]|jgi:hypothetical protein|uniref:hypothetical protein n=2 Tax=Oleiphilus TaxID=141450 RepID=UPI0007C3152A|nr:MULTISPECIES: hypothetical protein [unclassified Oleiphilus]KZY73008.1 hypothetical protein A3737_09595 [Oleiphilus sp. HI0065]KZY83547.1 hypothetical protein A3742_06765 [Oleiphilus sp. HI0071]KZY97823.1 hypothetical protein A3744_01185 [Oleiphilus sp. HI0073]KZZ52300.1 hypothetical protein A3760_00965 [Oleiphilus sp. HI0122]KZZ68876.1 hypothetical protein A3765_17905 [Oleiphilus sp. HI0130]KZZ77653.1 hypothetical protein A3767_14565 [Oleiphilus sp. HI0133]TNC81219.1 MAG: hypothetical pr
MAELSQEVLQEFSDRVAEICEQMELEPDQMLEAIGSTFIGAVMSFGKTSYQVEISGVASAAVETMFGASD